MATVTMLTLPSSARATYTSGPISTNTQNGVVAILDCDFQVTALTGGTSPTVTFKVSRVGTDGVLYSVWSPAAISAAGSFSQSIGPGCQTQADLGAQFQVDMILTGSPTSITFSGSIQAKVV